MTAYIKKFKVSTHLSPRKKSRWSVEAHVEKELDQLFGPVLTLLSGLCPSPSIRHQ